MAEEASNTAPSEQAIKGRSVFLVETTPAGIAVQTALLTEDGKLTFKSQAHGQKFGFEMDLFKGINLAASGWSLKGRNIIFTITKKDDDQEEYWPRLTKDKVKNSKISIDWSKWVDEDEVADAPAIAEDQM